MARDYFDWSAFLSPKATPRMDSYDPIMDNARDSAWEYYYKSGDYDCNPRNEIMNHLSRGISNFYFREDPMDERNNGTFGSADNGAGVRIK